MMNILAADRVVIASGSRGAALGQPARRQGQAVRRRPLRGPRQAYYQGLKGKLRSHVELVRRLYEKVGKDSAAAPFLAAALELAGVQVEVRRPAAKDALSARVPGQRGRSKPIGFYTWNETLADLLPLPALPPAGVRRGTSWTVPLAMAAGAGRGRGLLADYRKAIDFYAG